MGSPFSLEVRSSGCCGGVGLGGRSCCSSVPPCQMSITTPMGEQNKTSRQYPAKDGGTISGDRVHGLPSTRDHERSATCAYVQDVPSQGTLDSRATCGTSGPLEQGGPAHTHQLAAMPNPASRRERRKLAAAAKAASTKPPQTSGGTTEGSTAALSTPPQDSGQIGDTMTLTGTTVIGGAEADDRMDVAQSFFFL